MAAFEVRPLVVVREHFGGFHSAFPAFAPALVSHADSEVEALDELKLFLSEHFARLAADELLKFMLPENVVARQVSVLVPREELPRAERITTPLSLDVIELAGEGDARWVLIPALGHVTYVPRERSSELEELVRRDVLRMVSTGSGSGADYLDLLPAARFRLERPVVEVDSARAEKDGESRRQRVMASRRKAAHKLLDQIGRRVLPSRHEILGRDPAPLRSLLEGKTKVSVVLVGPDGAGKSALLQAAVAGPGALLERPIYATSGAELVAGQSFVGQLEQRVEEVMRAVELLDAVLYFEGLDDLFAGRPGGYEDIVGSIQPYLDQGRVRIVGELESDEYDRLQHRHVAFFSHLQRVSVEPLDRTEAAAVLASRSRTARRAGKPHLAETAAPLVVELVERYEPYRSLPGKAIALLEELCGARHAEPRADGSLEITEDDVLRGLGTKTGIPEFLLRDERSLIKDQVEAWFRRHLVGQGQAVGHVVDTLCAVKAGLQPSNKPLATFLFIGPTGVGKTELAKALALFLFGSQERMARFDMSEYADVFAAERLIRGTDREDGVLTRRIREQPFSVLLLDEIEKADPAVFDLLLQVCGEGRLGDARGKVVHFHNAIIIMTSNLGAQHRRSALGFGDPEQDARAYYLAEVQRHFRPEFLNRLDRVVCFYNLTRPQIGEVLRLSIDRIQRREGFQAKNVRLWLSERALDWLAEHGYSEVYGARGLRRHLEEQLVAPLAGVLSALGPRAEGSLLAVLLEAEPRDTEALALASGEPELGTELLAEARGQLSVVALQRRSKKSRPDPAPLERVSEWRREVRHWLGLSPITELRERLDEIVAQFGGAPGQKRPSLLPGAVVSQLSTEHAQIAELLEPLDRALSEIEDVEALLLSAFYAGEPPVALEPEAEAAYRRCKKALIPALLARVQEHEISVVVHELDEQRVLHLFLLPLLDYVRAQGWTAQIHVDRGEREAGGAWPPLAKRRWGPPLLPAQYLERFGSGPRPFESVLLRVKGHAAGALLSFVLGRFRYHVPQPYGEIWVRLALPRYELKDDDFGRGGFGAAFDREVGRRVPLKLQLDEGDGRVKPVPGQQFWEDMVPATLFVYWEEIILDGVIELIETGGRFLPLEL